MSKNKRGANLFKLDEPSKSMQRYDYFPYRFLEDNPSSNYGLIVLNQSFESVRNLLSKDIWSAAVCRGCADGGANILKRFRDETNENYLPDFISGDFDSIDQSTKDYYRSYPTIEWITTSDQNATDFTKAVRLLMGKCSQKISELVVFCSLGGRFDHSIGIIHSLYLLNTQYPNLQIYLLTEHDVTFLLHESKQNRIHVASKFKGDVCSLLPFGETAHVKTNGLKWNLTEEQELSFSKLVSSSNGYADPQATYVDVFTDKNIIWTMTYRRNKNSR